MGGNVSIIGAGVVGLILAKELSSMGIDTMVYDGKRTMSQGSDKASGVLSKRGLNGIGIDYSPAVLNSLSGAVIYSEKESLKVFADDTKALVVDRVKLVEICASEAKRAGARIQLSSRLTRSDIRKLAKSSSVLVGADGAVSMTASAFGFPHIRSYILTYKSEYSGAHIRAPSTVGLYFNKDVTRGFFGWTIPYSKSMVELGIGVSASARANSRYVFEQFVRNRKVSELIAGAASTPGKASMIPISPRRKTVIGNVLLVGDAAGQVKATTGGGLIFGTACAKVAAPIIERYINGRAKLSSYDSVWRKKYGRDLALHALLHRYYSMLDANSMDLTFRALRQLGMERFLEKHGDMDSPSLMAKRLFFRTAAK